MQIHTSIQPTEYKPAIEITGEKFEKPEVKVQTESKDFENNENSQKLQELKSTLEENNILLSFSQDDETKALVVKLVDKITGEEIRQIPNEVSLKLLAVNAKLQGNFVDEQS